MVIQVKTATTLGGGGFTTTPSGPTSIANKGYVDDNFLALSGSNNMTGNLIVGDTGGGNTNGVVTIKSYGTGTPSLEFHNDGVFNGKIFGIATSVRIQTTAGTQLQIHDTAVVSTVVVRAPDPVNATDLTTLQYAENNFLALSGGTLTGNLSIQSTSPTLTIRADGVNNPVFNLMSEETVAAQLYYVNAGDRIRFHKKDTTANATGGGVDNYFDMYADRTNFLKDVRVVTMGTNGTSLTTKDYVDDNFLALSGGTTTGNIIIDKTDANIELRSDGAGFSRVTFNHDGVRSGLLYGDTSATRIRHYTADGITPGTEVILQDTAVTVNGNITVAAGGTNGTRVYLDSDDSTQSSILWFRQDDIGDVLRNTGWVNVGAGAMTLRLFEVPLSGTGNNELQMKATTTTSTVDLRCSNPGTHGTSVLTRTTGVTEDTDQTIVGTKTFTRGTDDNAIVSIDAPTGRHPYLNLKALGTTRGTLAAFGSNLFLGFQGGCSLILRANTVELDKPLEMNNGDITGGEIALKERSSNGTNSVGIAAPDSVTSTYKMIMPSGPPSAGQSLEVASISGTLVYMQWV